jgi:hypothetical protein
LRRLATAPRRPLASEEATRNRGNILNVPRFGWAAMTPALHLRFFLSSPSDCREQRRLAARVVDDLVHGPEYTGRVYVDVFAYDDERRRVPMPVNLDPQRAISKYGGDPSRYHYCLAFFWRRFGTPVPPEPNEESHFLSGTEQEIETSCKAGRDTFVYVRTDEPKDTGDAESAEQYQRLCDFLQRFHNRDGSQKGSIQRYATPGELPELLRQNLSGILRRELDRHDQRWLRRVRTLEAIGGTVLAVLFSVLVWWQLTRPAIALTQACEPQFASDPARLTLRLSYSSAHLDSNRHQLLARLSADREGSQLGPRAFMIDAHANDTLVVFDGVRTIDEWPFLRLEMRSQLEDELIAASQSVEVKGIQCAR